MKIAVVSREIVKSAVCKFRLGKKRCGKGSSVKLAIHETRRFYKRVFKIDFLKTDISGVYLVKDAADKIGRMKIRPGWQRSRKLIAHQIFPEKII
ncbi:MAG TPA: hypothetical protein VGO50_09810 [Pyrinomonadaceae bacterium]|nr:hypothetical protein [Pyrinomonadaceae bacterium]